MGGTKRENNWTDDDGPGGEEEEGTERRMEDRDRGAHKGGEG